MEQLFKTPLRTGITVFIATLVVGFALSQGGFHFQGFSVVRGGDIAIANPQVAHKVFVDQKNINTEEGVDSGITLADSVPPGEHSVLVYNDLYWPWKKDVQVKSGETISVSPFLVRKNASGVIVTPNDEEYSEMIEEILNQITPSSSTPLLSSSGAISTWASNGSVFARWNGATSTLPEYFCNDEDECSTTITVLESEQEIRNLDFYKEREDVLMIAFSNGVFALEIDKRGVTQNFQPIYKGAEEPRFKKNVNRQLTVVDGTALFIIDL